jgi:valyl-tRNA synthetase
VAALRRSLDVLLRLFAPFLPYVTEEVWSWWREGSVHRAAWPIADELPGTGDPEIYTVAAAVLSAVRREKTVAKVSLRTAAERVAVVDTSERLAKLAAAEKDLREAGNIGELETRPGEPFGVSTILGPSKG